ncbi:MAG: hypothetical protein K5912_04440 [Alphaproteobacteria bacterium]|nr:hypothetical protein [Alphaproteobacteria bacterium]
MKALFGKNKTFLVSYNPDMVTFVETKGNGKTTVFYPSIDKMPMSVRASFASRAKRWSR